MSNILHSKIFRMWCIGAMTILIFILIGVGIFLPFVLDRKPSDSEPVTEPIELLVKKIDGTLLLFNTGTKVYEELLIHEPVWEISAFNNYLGSTIYYGTNEPSKVILSSSKHVSNLPDFTSKWTKSAIAIDYINAIMYVLDSRANRVNIVDLYRYSQYYHYTAVSNLKNPRDIIAHRKLYILQENSILEAFLDGSELKTLIDQRTNLNAFTIDRANNTLYYSHTGGIESYEIDSSLIKVVSHLRVASLSIKVYVLYFITNNLDTNNTRTLALCPLHNGRCLVADIQELDKDANLASAKVYETDDLEPVTVCGHSDNVSRDCDQMCFPRFTNYSCACSVGWKLNDDLKSCSRVSTSETWS